MHIAIWHDIKDPEGYAQRGETAVAKAPAGHELVQFVSFEDALEAFCVWQTDDAEALRSHLEEALGGVSEQTYHAVDEGGTFGLPTAGQAGPDAHAGAGASEERG